MNNVKLLVLSDLHLEKTNELKQEFLLSTINEKIEKTKNEGFEPVVIFAGDLHNSTKGYEFISKINAKCLYLAGNHEFWGEDYYETINKLKSEAPINAKFLHNDIASYGQYIILGTTLWTDIGQSLNKDILSYAGSRMNDMAYIKAASWYENSENIERLKLLYNDFSLEKRIEDKKWNALIQIDENQKAWDFLNNADAVLKAIKKTKSINEKIEDDLHSKSDWWKITNETYNETKEKIKLDGKKLTWTQFVNNLVSLYRNYSISEEQATLFLKNCAEREIIFQKLRKIENIANKQIVIASHHLPFYEEILVGNCIQEYNKVPVKLYNQVDKNLFMVRSGIDYPGFNYILRAKKGDLERDNDITHIVNYYNDGKSRMPEFLLEHTKLWIHGHEHHFRYCDYVKGIQILTNPSGSALSLFDTSSGEIKLNPHYMAYHKVKPNNVVDEINKIKKSLIATPTPFLKEQNLAKSVQIWALKHFNFKEHKKCLSKIAKASQEILLLSIQYMQTEEENDSKQNEILEKISFWSDSHNYNCKKIEEMHNDLLLAFNVRVNKHFCFQSYCTNSLSTHHDFHPWIMGNARPPQEINSDIIGFHSAKQSFETKENIRIALMYIQKLEEFLDKLNITHVYQVTKEQKELFDSLSEKALSPWRVSEKIEEKWKMFSDKALANNKKPKGMNLDIDF